MIKNTILLGLVCLTTIPLAAQEETNKTPWQKEHKGIDFKIKTGYAIGLGNAKGYDMLDMSISAGKRFDNMYFGLSSGALMSSSEGSNAIIPITIDWETFYGKGRIAPTTLLRIGYGINTASDIKIGKNEKIKMPNYLITQVMPGIRFGITRRADLDIGAGLIALTAVGGSTGTSGTTVYLSIGGSVNFHRTTDPKPKKPKKPKKPTRERGLQLAVEFGKNGFNSNNYFGFNLATAVTYKFNPHITAGIGAGCEILDGMDINGKYLNYNLNTSRSYSMYTQYSLGSAAKIFARGQYNFTTKRFSPFVACDAGVRLYQYSVTNTEDADAKSAIGKPSSAAIYTEPSVGFSLRTTNNSYIELKAGYAFAPKISGITSEFQDEFTYYASYRSPLKTSAPFVSLGFRHTFNQMGK